MTAANDAPVDLYIAVYPDPDAARGDWDTIKQLAKDDLIKVDGLILVSRRSDGKIHVDDDFHETRKGAVWGAVGGFGAAAGAGGAGAVAGRRVGSGPGSRCWSLAASVLVITRRGERLRVPDSASLECLRIPRGMGASFP